MLYQRPDGKVIYLSVEEFLRLDDEEVHSTLNSYHGNDAPRQMYYGSKHEPKEDNDSITPDYSHIDFEFDDEEINPDRPIDIDNIPDEMTE